MWHEGSRRRREVAGGVATILVARRSKREAGVRKKERCPSDRRH